MYSFGTVDNRKEVIRSCWHNYYFANTEDIKRPRKRYGAARKGAISTTPGGRANTHNTDGCTSPHRLSRHFSTAVAATPVTATTPADVMRDLRRESYSARGRREYTIHQTMRQMTQRTCLRDALRSTLERSVKDPGQQNAGR